MNVESLDEIYEIVYKSDEDLLHFFQRNSFVKLNYRCKVRNCRRYCVVRKKEGSNSLNMTFYCSRCRKDVSVLMGTFFENMRVPVRSVLKLMWLWSCDIRTLLAANVLKISRKIVIQQYRYFRDIVSWKLLQPNQANAFLMGGPGHVVQIDESVITKRKYNRGRLVPEKWVIGIYDVTSKKGYVKYVENRSADTLIPVIREVVRLGTEIWTDEWRAYRRLNTMGYTHRTVNHSRNFVDPVTGVCTNQVEGFWSCLKGFLRSKGVMSSPFLPEYIDLFMWRQIFGPTSEQRFFNLTAQICEKYEI